MENDFSVINYLAPEALRKDAKRKDKSGEKGISQDGEQLTEDVYLFTRSPGEGHMGAFN